MVLVDKSVWIRYLAGRAPYLPKLRKLLSVNAVCGHDLVYGELLIGDIGGHKKLLDEYERMRKARTVPHNEVVAFVRAHNLNGRLRWIEAHLLASALVEQLQIWTADPRFEAIASELGIAYTS